MMNANPGALNAFNLWETPVRTFPV